MSGQVRSPIWTFKRKFIPNILPLLVGTPFWICGIIFLRKGMFADGVEVAALGLIVAAVSLNWLGLVGNESMRKQLAERINPVPEALFVGISRPGYRDLLDPHEDVGFLTIDRERLTLRCERLNLNIPRDPRLKVEFAPNPHSLLGMGRWIKVEGHETTVYIEPRDAPTLRANRALGSNLRAQILAWK